MARKAPKDWPAKTSDTTYEQFCDWAVRELFDAICTGGIKEMRAVFKYSIVQAMATIFKEGGFKPASSKNAD